MALPITVLIAARNEEVNLPKCLAALGPASKVYVIDSRSRDRTAEIAAAAGAEVMPFDFTGGWPKKRQWALDTLPIATEWVLLLDADEVVPGELWQEIETAITAPEAPAAFTITKGFHFLGRKLRFGGFSFAAVLLIRRGLARFERIERDEGGMDMEVHERLIVNGPLGHLRTHLIHEDFKTLEAYLDRHNRYSSWEAALRHEFLKTGRWGTESVRPRLFGNAQERRRFLKFLAVRVPFEPWLWFAYHYFFKLGFLEGWPGYLASQIRSQYISQIRAKMYELRLRERRP